MSKFHFRQGKLDLTKLRDAIDAAPYGKRTQNALYLHISGVMQLPEELVRRIMLIGRFLSPKDMEPDIIKFALNGERVSLLYYPEFDDDPHPRLWRSITIKCDAFGEPISRSDRKYDWRKNPPILHRKERFVPCSYPLWPTFAALTKAEEEAGLLSDSRIGTLRRWRQLLLARGVRIDDHTLVEAAVSV